MSQLAQIPENTLTIDIAKMPVFYIPQTRSIVARQHAGMVLLCIDGRGVELTTIVAHKIGLTLARFAPKLEPGEMLVMAINGEKIELPGPYASRVSTALLRKADAADDWQTNNRRKLR